MQKSSLWENYDRDGFVSGVEVMSSKQAGSYRRQMEAIEAQHGALHYQSKMHTLLDFTAEIAKSPQVLETVETILGPDILLYDVTFIVKEPNTKSHVSWHQDLTYWGLSNDEQVSMWLALSPATQVSGCMRMIPGSHKQGRKVHTDIKDESNVLYRGQTVSGVDESRSIFCPLEPGQASFHHGWTLHASMPNRSEDRRIGLNVQYINPSARQTINPNATATLVRGKDSYGYYEPDVFASGIMLPADIERHAILEKKMKETWTVA
jgi:ectoine hydroxylase-related dioxygenase (phytanoyl-CoA dioxygenase family)